MNKLFIYYSMTGNGDIVSSKMEQYGYDIRKVIPKRRLPKNFVLSMFVGGFLGGTGHKAKLKQFDYNIDNYEEIVIGSPIWNGKLSCPINTVLKKIKLDNKKISFILYSGGGSAPKAIKKLNKKFNTTIVELKQPKNNTNELEKLACFKND